MFNFGHYEACSKDFLISVRAKRTLNSQLKFPLGCDSKGCKAGSQ